MSSIKQAINNYKYIKKTRIVDTNNGKYVIKKNKRDKKDIYNYLLTRNFNNFLRENKKIDDYEIYPFIKESNIPQEQKAIDLILTLASLHNKTTFYKSLSLDNIKKTYEDISNNIDYLFKYYTTIQDVIESKIYFTPAEYLLIRNISKVYQNITYSKKMIDTWYEKIRKKQSQRFVLLHKNLSMDHFLENESENILISWDKSEIGIVIYDFLSFYKNEYLKLDMSKLYDIYQSKYKFTQEEEILFLTYILIPPKIVLDKSFNSYIKTVEFTTYIDKSREFLSKQNEKNQKTNENE